MKNLFNTHFFRIPNLFYLALILISISSLAWGSPLIKKEDSMAGRIDSVRIEKSSVVGRIWRAIPYHLTLGAHVHVSLLDSNGKIIAQGTDRIPLLLPQEDSRNKFSSYKVSFSEMVSRSHSIHVRYVPNSHSRCGAEGS